MTGIGSKFLRNDGTDYKPIANITQMGEIGQSRDTRDTTDFDSEGGFREFEGGLRDGGELDLEMKFNAADSGQQDLQDDFMQDDPVEYAIRLNDSDKTEFQFKGLVTSFGISIPLEDGFKRKIKIKISGPITPTTWTAS